MDSVGLQQTYEPIFSQHMNAEKGQLRLLVSTLL